MQINAQIGAQICQSHRHKAHARGFFSKAYTPCYRTFVASYYFFFILELLVLKINPAIAVPDPAPTLLDSNFVEPPNLQLLFRPSGKYAASTHFIHIRVPFNFSQLLPHLTTFSFSTTITSNCGPNHSIHRWKKLPKSAALALLTN